MKHDDYIHQLKLQIKSRKPLRKVTWISLLVNIAISGLKFLCGILGNSQAIIADGVHSLSDSATDIAIIVGARYWSRPPDQSHPYGHQRIETFVTLFIGLVLFFTAGGLITKALSSVHDAHPTSTGWIAIIAAFVSIIVKEILYQWSIKIGKEIKSQALIANAWHHRSDALSSLPALAAVSMACIYPEWGFVDHIGAVVVSIFLFHVALKIVSPAIQELLETGACEEIIKHIDEIARQIEGVEDVHRVRSRYLSSRLIIDMHLIVNGGMPLYQAHQIADKVHTKIMESRDDVLDIVIHLEPSENF